MFFRTLWLVTVVLLSGCQKENNNLKIHQIDQLLEQQQYNQAFSLCTVGDDQEEECPDLLMRKANALRGLKQYEAAELALHQAHKLDQDNPLIMKNLAEINLAMGKAAEAQKIFEGLSHKKIKKSSVYNGLGVSLDIQGYHVAAQEQYRNALSLDPNNKHYQSNLGLSLAFSNNIPEAIAILKPLASKAKHRHNLALVYAMNHQIDEFHKLLENEMDEVDRVALLEKISYNLG